MCVEHLGCLEWMDDSSHRHYEPTKQNLMAWAFCPRKAEADVFMEACRGISPLRVAVVDPGTHFNGLANAVHRAGVPEIGFIARPTYLLKASRNGCLEKVDSKLMYAQLQAFAKTIHLLDRTAADQLRGS
jgi:hypothetical protein